MKAQINKVGNYWKSGKKAKLVIVAIVLVMLCLCCSLTNAIRNSAQTTPGAATEDQTAKPSDTVEPSITPTLTISPMPTNTATLEPPATLTAIAIGQTQTQAALNYQATQTQAAANVTATRQSYNATQDAAYAHATELAQYQDIYYQELTNYADNHIGELVRINIRVFNINSNTELQGFFAGTYDAVIVSFREPFSGIYENQSITVYGIVAGSICGTNAFGGTVCQPAIIDAFMDN
jgi:hypothetical protein